MAISSYGFPDTIAPGAVWANLHRTAGSVLGFADPASFRVTNTATRAVDVQTGTLYASGIYVSSNAVERINLPAVVSGSQYFMIVADIRWNDDSGGYRSTLGHIPGSAARTVPSRASSAGSRVQVPIALVRITAGAATPTEIVDLRGIRTSSGEYQIYDDLALNIYGYAGTTIHNATTGVTRARRANASYGSGWEITSLPPARANYSQNAFPETSNGWGSFVPGLPIVTEVRAYPLGDPSPAAARGATAWLVEVSLAYQRAGGAPALTGSATGALTDHVIARIPDPRVRPQRNHVPVTVYYDATSGGNAAGGGLIMTGGEVLLTSLAPNTTLRSNTDAQNRLIYSSPVLRIRASYVIDDVAL